MGFLYSSTTSAGMCQTGVGVSDGGFSCRQMSNGEFEQSLPHPPSEDS